MESYPLPHHSANLSIALFEISNASSLRSRLVAAARVAGQEGDTEREKLDFAFVDGSMITSRLHLLTAVNQALLAKATQTLRTKTVHSEVLWELEPGTNINDSLKHFGLTPSTTSLLLVKVAPMLDPRGASPKEDREVYAGMLALVEGRGASLDSLGRIQAAEDGSGGTNTKGLRKIYKLNLDAVWAGVKAGSEEERVVLDGLCISAVALKTVAA